jgi:hypothetical protein
MERPRRERTSIRRMLAAAGNRVVYVQGALFPHAGYERRYQVLHHEVTIGSDSAVLLCTTCVTYPFSRQEFDARFALLRDGGRHRALREGDLWLFVPRG